MHKGHAHIYFCMVSYILNSTRQNCTFSFLHMYALTPNPGQSIQSEPSLEAYLVGCTGHCASRI